MPMPAVSAAEVAALKADGERMSLDDADTTLETVAEIIAFQVHQCRHFGADQAEVLHDVELLVRAAELDREAIRTARDTLGSLGYGADVTKLLTALARRARPKPPPYFRGVGHQCASVLRWIGQAGKG
jgi:hypothetical protein